MQSAAAALSWLRIGPLPRQNAQEALWETAPADQI